MRKRQTAINPKLTKGSIYKQRAYTVDVSLWIKIEPKGTMSYVTLAKCFPSLIRENLIKRL